MSRVSAAPQEMNRTFVQLRAPSTWLVRACAVGAVGAAFFGCAHGALSVADPPVGPYRLGREDLVEVQVWKEPALSATVTVRPDGKITLPMVGELTAEGRTTLELQAELVTKLRPLVPEPSVAVIVKEVKAARFFVLGEVAHPGAYPLSGAPSVLEAMAVAGGPTEFARTGRLVVLRPGPGKEPPRRIVVSLADLVGGKRPPVALFAGDTIFVP